MEGTCVRMLSHTHTHTHTVAHVYHCEKGNTCVGMSSCACVGMSCCTCVGMSSCLYSLTLGFLTSPPPL